MPPVLLVVLIDDGLPFQSVASIVVERGGMTRSPRRHSHFGGSDGFMNRRFFSQELSAFVLQQPCQLEMDADTGVARI